MFIGILLKDVFPQLEMNSNTMIFILLGCLTYGLFIAYIFTKWAQISTAATEASAGAVIGLFIGLFFNFFNLAMMPEATNEMAA